MAPYRVDEAPMDTAKLGALLLRLLPAHRGEEVTDAAIDDPRLAVWNQMGNRLHAQAALLLWRPEAWRRRPYSSSNSL